MVQFVRAKSSRSEHASVDDLLSYTWHVHLAGIALIQSPDHMRRTLLPLFLLLGASTTAQYAGPDTSLCVNSYAMQADPIGAGTGIWTLVAGCAVITDPIDPNAFMVNMCVGSNVFLWTVNDSTGAVTSDIVVVDVFDINAPAANAGPDQVVCAPASSAILTAGLPVYPAFGQWTVVLGTGVITDPFDPYSAITGLGQGDTQVAWLVDNGPCGTSVDTATISVMICTGVDVGSVELEPLTILQELGSGIRITSTLPADHLAVLDALGREVVYTRAPQEPNWTMLVLVSLPAGAYTLVLRHRDASGRTVRRFLVL